MSTATATAPDLGQQLPAIDDISAERAPAIYGHNKLDAFFERVATEVRGEAPDLATKKGRDRIASQSAKVSRSKTAVEKPGRDYLKKIKELPKTIETELREFCLKMDDLRDEVRAPLTAWEKAEQTRTDDHTRRIEHIRDTGTVTHEVDAIALKSRIAELEAVELGAIWEEFEPEATRTTDRALSGLRDALIKREEYDADQAELAQLRIKAAERAETDRLQRVADEAASKARAEVEAAANAERAEAARLLAEANAATERAERERVAAAQRAEQALVEANQRAERATAAERQRQVDADAEIERQRLSRENDRAHRAKVNGAALAGLVAGGLTEECAKAAITLIIKGQVPAISIQY